LTTFLPKRFLLLVQTRASAKPRPSNWLGWERGEQALQKVTGGYWDAPNAAVKANKHAYDRKTQQQLWRLVESLQSLVSFWCKTAYAIITQP
jgi:hypothetical protein